MGTSKSAAKTSIGVANLHFGAISQVGSYWEQLHISDRIRGFLNEMCEQSRSVYMRNAVRGLCVAVIVAFTAHTFGEAAQDRRIRDAAFLLEAGKAGSFEIGATVDEIYSLAGRNYVHLVPLFIEGMFEPALEIQLPGSSTNPSIVARIREWPCSQFSIWSIEVRDRRFRTREGLGIGSTLGELRRHYRVEMGSMEDGGISAIIPSMMNMSFALDAMDAASNASKVKSIFMPADPKRVRRNRCPQLGPL